MSFPSVAEAGIAHSLPGGISLALPGVSNAQGWAALGGFALEAVLFTGINGVFPALPELGSHRQFLASLLFLPTLSIFGFQPLHLFPASSPFCSRCNRHKQGGEREVLHRARREFQLLFFGTFAPWTSSNLSPLISL